MATGIVQRRSYRRWRAAPYEEMRAAFRWQVPSRYNIAADVLDKHEPSRLAMFWEDWQGNERSLTFGDMQALTNRTANALRDHGVGAGDRVAVMLPPLPEAAATFLATYKLGAILLSLSILYGDDAIVHRLRDCSANVIVTDAANRDRIDRIRADLPDLEHVLVVDEAFGRAVEQASDRFEMLDTPADHPAQIYYTSGTTGLAKGIVHAHRYLRNGGYDPQQTVYVLEKYSVRNLFASRPCSGRWPRSETSRTATPPSRSGMPARPVSR
jgi:acetyl-CoA synthetase